MPAKPPCNGKCGADLDEAGHRVIAIAPTASAAKTLRAEGFKDATTVADFLQNGPSKFDLRGAVVICDEAGLQSNRQGEELLRLAQQHEMRVIFVGDVRQHVSVEAGDFLRVLETHSNLSRWEVTEIQRQKHAGYKEAVGLLSSGAARDGLAALDKLGWVHEGQANYLKDAAAAYFHLTDDGKNLDRCLAVSPTWEENRHLTHEIRSGLKERDLLPKEDTACTVHDSLRWTVQQRGNWRNYQPGQSGDVHEIGRRLESRRIGHGRAGGKRQWSWYRRPMSRKSILPSKYGCGSFDVGLPRPIDVCPGDKILIRANARPLGLINGQVLTVEKIEPDGALHTREGITVPATFKQWTHGYVVTSHKAQGRTCERVVVAAARLDAKSSYVACSRGRELCSVHTPDKAALMAHLPEGNRKAGLDVLVANPRTDLSVQLRSTGLPRNHGRSQAHPCTSKSPHGTGHARWSCAITRNVSESKRPSVWPCHGNRSLLPSVHALNFEPVQSQRTGIGI